VTGPRVVVIGGGVSGLSAAHHVLRLAPSASVLLFEERARVGGSLVTEHQDGFLLDGGPDSWVAAKPHATSLAKSLGLEDDLVGTLAANRRSYIAWNGRLHPLPEGFVLGVPTSIMPILRTPLFSMKAKLRMALEPFIRRRRPSGEDDDESIDAFVRRRLGAEVAERLVAPLLGGIYGGDAGALSIRATLPQFVEMEAQKGSLIHAMKSSYRPLSFGPKPSMFTSLRGGLGSLVSRLEASLGDDRIRRGVKVRRVAPLADDPRGRYAIEAEGDTVYADHVVLATPAYASAEILGAQSDRLRDLLATIPYASTAIVFLAFHRSEVARPLDATGYIVPRAPGRPALAATWVTSKWADRAPEGQVLIRVFLGGTGHEDVMAKDDAELARLARDELAGSMSLHATPHLTRVFRFARASPQPLVGHGARLREVATILRGTPGIYLVASGMDGVGIPDCIRQAEAAARAITA
jgi:protoporphyrinogen/coproporphyrinogen III oxidase